jgi:hypothetical protein
MPPWTIHIIGGGRSEELGKVDAADEREAMTRAIRVFRIPRELHGRIAVAPTTKFNWLRSLQRWYQARRK